MFAHIAGVPVEETALSLAPVAATVAGAAGVKLRGQVRRRRESKANASPPVHPIGERAIK